MLDSGQESKTTIMVVNAQQSRMKKPSAPDPEPIKTSVRLPPSLLAELKRAGKHNGRSMNAEILARIMESCDRATFRQLVKQNDELRSLMREMLDRIELLK